LPFSALAPEARFPCLDPIRLVLFWLLPPRGRCYRSLVRRSHRRLEARLSWQASSAADLQTSSSSTSMSFPYSLSFPSIASQLFGLSASPSLAHLSPIHFVG
jgi:hypothetical protein